MQTAPLVNGEMIAIRVALIIVEGKDALHLAMPPLALVSAIVAGSYQAPLAASKNQEHKDTSVLLIIQSL
jgi:hypothetical protein